MKKLVLFFICAFAVVGCNDGGGSGGGSSSKSIFSLWTNQDHSDYFDLTGGQFNQPIHLTLTFESGHKCTCDLTVAGTEKNGTATFNNGAYVSGTGNGVDPGCSSINSTGTYTKSGNQLIICGSTECDTYL